MSSEEIAIKLTITISKQLESTKNKEIILKILDKQFEVFKENYSKKIFK